MSYYKTGSCYICEKKLIKSHSFYNELCPDCGDLNFEKRNQSLNLTGYTALVTGGRIKIGFETAIKLLRAGAKVVVTSRFPNDTYLRYTKEAGFEKWQNNLQIIGADFRHIPSVELLIEEIKSKYDTLDIIINNAAQTVRKPSLFYKHLIENENKAINQIQNNQIIDVMKHSGNDQSEKELMLFKNNILNNCLSTAQLSQIPLLPEDEIKNSRFFPEGKFDKDGQQEDRRDANSWMYELDDFSLIEFYEVLNINLISPYLLNTKLKDLLVQSRKPSFIINVSAMEGNFHHPDKKSRHPHTNMAKAALNMMTRTAAQYYAKYNIFMNSVDTGWITNEKPFPFDMEEDERKSRMAIDEVDGAARILNPIFQSLKTNCFVYGKLFKNYEEYPW